MDARHTGRWQARLPGSLKREMRSRRVASVLSQLHAAENQAMHLRARLGLDPVSRARVRDTRPRFGLMEMWGQLDAGEQDEGTSAGDLRGRHRDEPGVPGGAGDRRGCPDDVLRGPPERNAAVPDRALPGA